MRFHNALLFRLKQYIYIFWSKTELQTSKFFPPKHSASAISKKRLSEFVLFSKFFQMATIFCNNQELSDKLARQHRIPLNNTISDRSLTSRILSHSVLEYGNFINEEGWITLMINSGISPRCNYSTWLLVFGSHLLTGALSTLGPLINKCHLNSASCMWT